MARAANRPHGILWEGPSPLDGAPLVAISTWPKPGQHNVKTGVMAQVYILRSDVPPLEAVATGQDVSICGNCPMRSPEGYKGRGCYVEVGRGPTAVYKAYKAGKYKYFGLDLFSGLPVRWGAYGDPAVLPEWLVRHVNSYASGHTGYTHQWRLDFARWTRGVFMASVETRAQEERARSEGWGTFRAGASDSSDKGNAWLCLNEREGVSCADCMACDGDSSISIFIPAHGWGSKNVPANRLIRKKAERHEQKNHSGA